MDTFDKLVATIRKSVKTEHGIEILWRMSGGNLDKSRLIVKSLLPHYSEDKEVIGAPDKEFNEAFDFALGELNGGTEIEWLS